jgi:hypothetical protein
MSKLYFIAQHMGIVWDEMGDDPYYPPIKKD